ncbi:hypothetical protein R75461_08009 [Paraburkholderia nemoris]|uniref:transglycosylase n=1 Tax=Paraburkholderia nemoris TaxID=2793076 RepID=UPI001B181FB6|nr:MULTISPECIES: transglycosylase [Paraburkholderia]CAE6861546.1 hypothetical protein R75461_08009 [Paraburkholderia nemoris]
MDRQALDFGIPDGPDMPHMDYVNVPYSIAFAITGGLATLCDLQTVYGTEDLWDLIEIHAVNCFNEAHALRG